MGWDGMGWDEIGMRWDGMGDGKLCIMLAPIILPPPRSLARSLAYCSLICS